MSLFRYSPINSINNKLFCVFYMILKMPSYFLGDKKKCLRFCVRNGLITYNTLHGLKELSNIIKCFSSLNICLSCPEMICFYTKMFWSICLAQKFKTHNLYLTDLIFFRFKADFRSWFDRQPIFILKFRCFLVVENPEFFPLRSVSGSRFYQTEDKRSILVG